jgi:hypothetical protein
LLTPLPFQKLQLLNPGILVFVTGKNEIDALCRKLRATFPSSKSMGSVADKNQSQHDADEADDLDMNYGGRSKKRRHTVPVADEANETVMGLEEGTSILSGTLAIKSQKTQLISIHTIFFFVFVRLGLGRQ